MGTNVITLKCPICGKSHASDDPHVLDRRFFKAFQMNLGIDKKYAAILRSPQFLKYVSQPFMINTSYNVPLVAGNSKDYKTIYIDKDVDLMDHKFDITPYLAMHERSEWVLMHVFGLSYNAAHPIAEKIENAAVKIDGRIPDGEYEDHYDLPIKQNAKDKTDLPPDLDPKPYVDSGMKEVARELEAA